MDEQKLSNNCLLKITKDLIEKNILGDLLNKYDISDKCFLIVDKRGSIFLNNYFNFTEIINKGIFSIDSIYKSRKPYKSYDAIYLISGKEKIIHKIIKEDFNSKNRIYKCCHLFIIDEITNDLIDFMAQKDFLKYIKTLKQISIKYITIDKNIFSYGEDINFNSIYNLFEDRNKINNINVSNLFNVCIALNIYPNIIYFNPDKKCKYLAENVNKELKNYFTKKKKEGILLITTRFIDFLAPIQFNAIYQNLLLENFKNKNIKYRNEIIFNEHSYILDYKDEFYSKYKDKIYIDVMSLVSEDLRQFKNSEIGKAMTDLDNNMQTAAKNIIKYNTYNKLLAEHINICLKLKELGNKRHLFDLIDAQKTIISKINNKGKKISKNDIISIIKDNKKNFEKKDFMRLISMIKYYHNEIDIREIYNILKANNIDFSNSFKKIIDFLNEDKITIDIGKLNELDKSLIEYREKTNYNTMEEQNNKDDKRYNYIKESKLTTICDMACKNKLPENLFTYVEKPENIKIQKKKLTTNFDNVINKKDDEKKQNLILFNIGGLSNLEISSLEKGDKIGQYNMNLILGSNKIYNSEEYFVEINDYINKKNFDTGTIIETKEEDINKNLESKDIKVDVKGISFDDKGSKEKMKNIGNKQKNRKNSDDTAEDDYK